tara:strand:- start:174 stop:374 length:201 start_codon:yes stop_codon:yes gene_type:complete
VQALDQDARQYPAWAFSLLALMCAFLIIYSLALNGLLSSAITPCHAAYWWLYALPVPFYGSVPGLC